MHNLVENCPFSNNAHNIFGRLFLEIMHTDTNSNVKIILYRNVFIEFGKFFVPNCRTSNFSKKNKLVVTVITTYSVFKGQLILGI